MATTGISLPAVGVSPAFQLNVMSPARNLKPNLIFVPARRSAIHTKRTDTTTTKVWDKDGVETDVLEVGRANLKDYFEQSKDLIKSDGGPPRWFSPLECGSRLENSPLLLFLPGVDGVGLGLILHHQKLGKIFDIWCLHIPVMDRTTFPDLVKLVGRTIRSENYRLPNRPIYLVGESFGACLALDVAASNPDTDLVLILANPATCSSKSLLQPLMHLLEVTPDQLYLDILYTLSLMGGDPLRMAMDRMERILPLKRTVAELSHGLVALSSYLSVLADMLPRETLLWKLQMLNSASEIANSHLPAVKAQTLILSSGRDQLLPSLEEGERLSRALQKCDLRKFNDNGHFLFLEDGVDLVTILKGTCFYRHAKHLDYVLDYMPPTSSEIKQICESYRSVEQSRISVRYICKSFSNLVKRAKQIQNHEQRKFLEQSRLNQICRPMAMGWIEWLTSPVMLSTLESGMVVRSLSGIPLEGPVLLVGNHMLLGCELIPMATGIMAERNIPVRGIAHPMFFGVARDGLLPYLIQDLFRLLGAVPVTATNFYKLLSSKSHALLYPGGMRESLHRKGEACKLFWPEQSEFVRMAARFGAKIIPFGVVGEDDVSEVVFDYDDLMKIPCFKAEIEELADKYMRLSGINGEDAKQHILFPAILPKLPGRFYFYFGKPIETEGRGCELRNREKCQELYLQVKAEVESCIDYLRGKREKDPYRNILARVLYQAAQGFTSKIPTFEL